MLPLPELPLPCCLQTNRVLPEPSHSLCAAGLALKAEHHALLPGLAILSFLFPEDAAYAEAGDGGFCFCSMYSYSTHVFLQSRLCRTECLHAHPKPPSNQGARSWTTTRRCPSPSPLRTAAAKGPTGLLRAAKPAATPQDRSQPQGLLDMGCSQQNSTSVGSATREVAASRLHTWGPSYITDCSDTGSSFPELIPALGGAEELARPPAAVQVYWQASGAVRSAGSAFQSSWKKQRGAQGDVCPAIPAGITNPRPRLAPCTAGTAQSTV